ncbi:MAG: hypothetical protein KGL95_12815 [Patescibacteria group bacterium]|nr:hypothetical protein [Patescibacteria group bacterium]
MEQGKSLPIQSVDWGRVSTKAKQDGWKRRRVMDFFLRARFTHRRSYYKEVSDGSGWGHLAQLQTVVRRGREFAGVFDYEYNTGQHGNGVRREQVIFSTAETTDGQKGAVVQASISHLTSDSFNQVTATFDPDGSLNDCRREIIPSTTVSPQAAAALVKQQGSGTAEIGVVDPKRTHLAIEPSVFALMDNLGERIPQRPLSQLKYITS